MPLASSDTTIAVRPSGRSPSLHVTESGILVTTQDVQRPNKVACEQEIWWHALSGTKIWRGCAIGDADFVLKCLVRCVWMVLVLAPHLRISHTMVGEEVAGTSMHITLSAVGDIMMWRQQIAAARSSDASGYCFDYVFNRVAPILRRSDLVIGNLETTLSGRRVPHQLRNPKNGFPRFSCPDALAPALKRAGFHVLTTANNHCMDHGVPGLRRTLNVLDRYGIKHTGTSRSLRESRRLLVLPVRGIKVGILAYTYGTNGIKLSTGQQWAVNRLREARVLTDIKRIRRRADIVVVALHFGREFRRRPDGGQVRLVRRLMRAGADIILGSHPHVLQPVEVTRVKRADGRVYRCAAIFSLGNFVSRRMWENPATERGVILMVRIAKGSNGRGKVMAVRRIPTLTRARGSNRRPLYDIQPMV